MAENKQQINIDKCENVAAGIEKGFDQGNFDSYDLSMGRVPTKHVCMRCGKEFYVTRGDNEHLTSKHMNYCSECRGNAVDV